ncbi:hypothetical protein [Phytohabitans kaempferiae]|uniref:HTH cro/C1-type domain-containing protein n=1 Tax=Phytohabitans kaempferiae TaxID=1620943 RepID=A0ABV6M9K5_9ACTN
MRGDTDADGSMFAARLETLLATRVDPETGRAWTTRAVSKALLRYGHQISHVRVGRLRSGESSANPEDIEAFARLFEVPVSYFFPGLEDDPEERRLRAAIARDPQLRAIAMRLAEQGPMPKRTADAILHILEQVQVLTGSSPVDEPPADQPHGD